MAAKCWLLAALLSLSGCAALNPLGGLSEAEQSSFDAHLNLALRYIEAGNRELANIHLSKAKAVDSDAAQLAHGYALLYQMEGDSALAGQFYRRAIAKQPGYTLAHYHYGALLYRSGELAAAREQMVLASADLGSERRPQALYILGLCEHQLGDDEAALAAYRSANRLAPAFAEPYLASAQLLVEQRSWQPALAQLQRYDQLTVPSADSLWLEVQVAAQLDLPDLFASASLALRNLFPDAPQTASLRARYGVSRAAQPESRNVQ